MNIYKGVPELFHEQFVDTLEKLPKEKNAARKIKKLAPLVAAAVLAVSTLTVGAACLFQWHQAAKDSLGVNDDIAAQLTEQGNAKEEFSGIEANGVTIDAIQSVMTDNYCYVLLSVSVPEGITVDGDTLFKEVSVNSEAEFAGCVANLITDSVDGADSLWEVVLIKKDGVEYGGVRAVISMVDIVKTEKPEIIKTLVEGEWNLSFSLPEELNTLVMKESMEVKMGHHDVRINKVVVSPFAVRLYSEKEELQHAAHYQNVRVTGVRYQDGTVITEDSIVNATRIHEDENTGESYLLVELQEAIAVEKYETLIFAESSNERFDITETAVDEMKVLYERAGHKIITDNWDIYLWDCECQVGKKLISLSEIGFDYGKGDTVQVGPGGTLLQISVHDEIIYVQVNY